MWQPCLFSHLSRLIYIDKSSDRLCNMSVNIYVFWLIRNNLTIKPKYKSVKIKWFDTKTCLYLTCYRIGLAQGDNIQQLHYFLTCLNGCKPNTRRYNLITDQVFVTPTYFNWFCQFDAVKRINACFKTKCLVFGFS